MSLLLLQVHLQLINDLAELYSSLSNQRVLFLLRKAFEQLSVSLQDIELQVGLELAKADRAQLHRLAQVFLQVVGAIHDAVVVDAVPNPEHVANLMHHNLDGAIENLVVVGMIVLLFEEVLVVTSEGKHPCPFLYAGYAEHEVPFILWVKVAQSHAYYAEKPLMQTLLQLPQYVFGVILHLVGVVVDTVLHIHFGYVDRLGYLYCRSTEESSAVVAQARQETFGDVSLHRQDQNNVALLSNFVVHLTFVSIERLPLFLMIPEPVGRLWRSDRLEEWHHSFESFFGSKRRPWQAPQGNPPSFLVRNFEVTLFHFFNTNDDIGGDGCIGIAASAQI